MRLVDAFPLLLPGTVVDLDRTLLLQSGLELGLPGANARAKPYTTEGHQNF